MTKIWKNPEEMRNRGLDENPEKYVEGKSCWCDREVPQSYGMYDLKQLTRGISGAMYDEIEKICKIMDGEWRIKDIVAKLDSGIINKRWISTIKIRRYVYGMVCQGLIAASVVENENGTFSERFRWAGQDKMCPMRKLMEKTAFKKAIKDVNESNAEPELDAESKVNVCTFRWRESGHKRGKPQE